MNSLKSESPLLSMLLTNSHVLANDSSIISLSASLRPEKKINSKDFLPFINERNSTGKLIKSELPNPSFTKTAFHVSKNPKPSKSHRNVAFFRTISESNARVSKKTNDSLPVGLYNPHYPDKTHLALSKSSRFLSESHQRRSSLDYIDLNEVYSKHKVSTQQTINIDKQLSRKISPPSQFSEQSLYIPSVNLPEYLKKLKGLYHVGELSKSKIYDIRKDANERTLELKEKLNQHIANLRNINTFHKNYGTKCSWKLSSELF